MQGGPFNENELCAAGSPQFYRFINNYLASVWLATGERFAIVSSPDDDARPRADKPSFPMAVITDASNWSIRRHLRFNYRLCVHLHQHTIKISSGKQNK